MLISQIVHSLSVEDSLRLIERSREALTPKGTIAIHEFLLGRDRAYPVPGALFSVNMLVNTPGGRSYSVEEMKGWLSKAGFKTIKATELGDMSL